MNHFIVRQGKIAYFVGAFIICAALGFGLLEIVYHTSPIPIWIYIVIFAMLLLGIFVWLEAKNRKLLVDNDILYYNNTFGQMKRFCLHDIGYAEAASDTGKGQDNLKIYDKEGNILCRLECSMNNAHSLLIYLYDNGIEVDIKKVKEQSLTNIIMQQVISREEIPGLAEKTYKDTEALINKWKEKNKKLGADIAYGYIFLRGEKVNPDAEIQREESRCYPEREEELPEDFLCIMELMIKKDDYFIRDKKGNLLIMDFPVFYNRRTKAVGEELRLYYNGSCQKEIETGLAALEKYLPGHRFLQVRLDMEYELMDYQRLM